MIVSDYVWFYVVCCLIASEVTENPVLYWIGITPIFASSVLVYVVLDFLLRQEQVVCLVLWPPIYFLLNFFLLVLFDLVMDGIPTTTIMLYNIASFMVSRCIEKRGKEGKNDIRTGYPLNVVRSIPPAPTFFCQV